MVRPFVFTHWYVEAYNADFDGDQMAIHVPLSEEAQAEARLLLLAAEHILNPKDGKPVVTPSQDMVLGNYYLTMEEEGREGEGMVFKDIDEAVMAYRNGYVHLHTRVGIAVDSMPDKPWKEDQHHKIMVTTVGKRFSLTQSFQQKFHIFKKQKMTT